VVQGVPYQTVGLWPPECSAKIRAVARVKKMKSSESPTPSILIADDQADVLEALRFLVKGEGYRSEAVTSPAGVMEAVESRDFDVVLMDLN
jgi:PleD family two-component response regulator